MHSKIDQMKKIVLYGQIICIMRRKKKSENRGGKRIGAGRKASPHKTETISFRVRKDWAENIKEVVSNRIKNLASESNQQDINL